MTKILRVLSFVHACALELSNHSNFTELNLKHETRLSKNSTHPNKKYAKKKGPRIFCQSNIQPRQKKNGSKKNTLIIKNYRPYFKTSCSLFLQNYMQLTLFTILREIPAKRKDLSDRRDRKLHHAFRGRWEVDVVL